MSDLRPSALAGSWYPADPDELTHLVREWLDGAAPLSPPPDGRPLLVVAPHAGYAYSGPTAGLVHAALRADPPGRVVIMAPSHRAHLDRIALSSAAGFATPLGVVPLDRSAVASLAASPAFALDDRAHEAEHAVEIQLPFLQMLGDGPPPAIVPLLVPRLAGDLRERAAADLAGLRDPDTVFLVSSDFTHYGASYGYLPFRENVPVELERLDTGAILRILAGDGAGLRRYGRETGITMCGIEAAALALDMGLPSGHEGALLGYARSGDRDGDYSLSVSYAALVLSTGAPA